MADVVGEGAEPPRADGAEVRATWERFAARRGGRFVETERRGWERVLPAAIWRPVIVLPLQRWRLRLEGRQEQRLSQWPLRGGGRDERLAYATVTSVRYRSADGFRFGLSTSRSDDTHRRQRHNVEYGLGTQLPPPLDAFRVHARDQERAVALFRRGPILEDLAALDAAGPIQLAVVTTSGWLGLPHHRRYELRLEARGFPTTEAELAERVDVVAELFLALRRAGSVDESAGASGS